MRRLRITLAYDGTDFHGWQVQAGLPTIQGLLEEIVSGIEKRPVHVAGSGRTDAGVHALAQVAAFSLENPIPPDNLKRAMNRLLPPAIRVLAAEEVATDFHPRFDALSKTYEYRIFRGEICSPFERRYVHHHPYPCIWEKLVELAPYFEGLFDFSAFAASDARDRNGGSKVRRIFSSTVELEGDRAYYRVQGSGFLKHMVRNMVGTLLQAGQGNVTAATLDWLLSGKADRKAGPRAPASGLFLTNVEYGEELGLYDRDDQEAREDEECE